jgi:hypothetical protein
VGFKLEPGVRMPEKNESGPSPDVAGGSIAFGLSLAGDVSIARGVSSNARKTRTSRWWTTEERRAGPNLPASPSLDLCQLPSAQLICFHHLNSEAQTKARLLLYPCARDVLSNAMRLLSLTPLTSM